MPSLTVYNGLYIILRARVYAPRATVGCFYFFNSALCMLLTFI